MPAGFQPGDQVLVAAQRLGLVDEASALVKREVLATCKRSVQLDGKMGTVWIGSSNVHRDAGVLILRIGDLATELATLDPLAKAIDHHSRLLLGPGYSRVAWIRTVADLRSFWQQNHNGFTHVVLVGHGQPKGLAFMDEGLVPPTRIATEILTDDIAGLSAKTFLSTACQTGREVFGKPFSGAGVCSRFFGPQHKLNGAIAGLVAQRYLNEVFLFGHQPTTAIRRATSRLPAGSLFVMWQNKKRVSLA